jgi:death-on-curing protein
MAKNWFWLDSSVLRAVHDEQLVEHGGLSGVRDAGLFESELSRSPNMAAYGVSRTLLN